MSRPLPVEPWTLREPHLDLDSLPETESLFALSNGHIGLRGNLDEGEPHGMQGTYLSGFYENHPLPYAESGYGYPESGETIVNVTNGKIIRLLLDDEPFDVREGRVIQHERVLDMRAGTLERKVDWTSPFGRRVRVTSTRLVSFPRRTLAAIAYEVEAVDERVRVILQSELLANEEPPQVTSGDPRVAEALDRPLVPVLQEERRHGAILVHRTGRSGLMVAAGMGHDVEAPGACEVEHTVKEDWARTTVVAALEPGQRLRLVKYLGYAWTETHSAHALRDQVAATLTGARFEGWDALLFAQRQFLDEFWDGADVEVEGDPLIQQAVRFSLFQVLQSAARAEQSPIGAKGLTGTGYSGHTFWDIEGFVVPVLAVTIPDAARDALRWRASTLDRARGRAGTLGLGGAAFPWRTITGEETSAYWPAGTAALHINADIARAFEIYRAVTGDESLEREGGLEVLVETARLWRSVGHHDDAGRWHLNGVTGPDEYTAVVDDNIFTNLMAVRNLRAAAGACVRHPDLADRLGVTDQERDGWLQTADSVHVPYDAERQVHPQHEHFTRLDEWVFREDHQYPLLLHQPYFQLYRKQVVKQADLVLAMHWFPDAFTEEEKARNFDYYERRTVRDSSLSACTQAVLAAELGHMQLARDYLYEAALVDLRDLHANTGHGLHIASLAGAWMALVAGFGGLRTTEEEVRLAPCLPPQITRLTLKLRWRGVRVRAQITQDELRLTARDDTPVPLRVLVYGELRHLTRDEEIVAPVRPRTPLLPTPAQPPGRSPAASLQA